MNQLVKKFKNGILYTAQPHKTFKEYGEINTTFGLVNLWYIILQSLIKYIICLFFY